MSLEKVEEIRMRCKKSDHEPNFDEDRDDPLTAWEVVRFAALVAAVLWFFF